MQNSDATSLLPARRHRLEALAWAVGLSAFFFLVYGTCNWITSQRAHVGRAGFGWERSIPFVPAMIVPYMSIDLFFFAAPFLCRGRAEMRRHARRVVLAVVVAGACFLLFPLRTTYTRPAVTGVYGAIFAFLGGFDKPFNLVPSLHLALLTLLWLVYSRATRGAMRLAVQAWFVLIALSAVLTYQHHLVDVAAGLALGMLCLYVFLDQPGDEAADEEADAEAAGERTGRSPKAAGWYGVGSLSALAGAVMLRHWGPLLLWPALALGVMAAAYLGLGPAVFRKSAGRLSAPARFVLAPVRLGLFFTWVYYKRRGRAYDQITPGLLVGRSLTAAEARRLAASGVAAVLDLTCEFSAPGGFAGLPYCNVAVLDLTPPTAAQLRRAVGFIRRHSGRGDVYVHCAQGYSRSACAAAAYLLACGGAASVEEAVARVRAARPRAARAPRDLEAVRRFAAHEGARISHAGAA